MKGQREEVTQRSSMRKREDRNLSLCQEKIHKSLVKAHAKSCHEEKP